MLTGLTEGARRKADMYWPNKKGDSLNFGDRYENLTVTNLGDVGVDGENNTTSQQHHGVIRVDLVRRHMR